MVSGHISEAQKVKMILFFTVESEAEPDCRVDQDCPSTLNCLREQCQNPCQISNPCIGNQVCSVTNHIVGCACPEGLIASENGFCQKGRNACFCFCSQFIGPWFLVFKNSMDIIFPLNSGSGPRVLHRWRLLSGGCVQARKLPTCMFSHRMRPECVLHSQLARRNLRVFPGLRWKP